MGLKLFSLFFNPDPHSLEMGGENVLFACSSVFFVHNLGTPGPICLKFVIGNSVEPRKYSKPGLKNLSLFG